MLILISILALFFAANMGGSSFGVSFAASYGSRLINRTNSALLFTIFVFLGAVFFGEHVSNTLARDIIPQALMTRKAMVVIFLSAGISMFVANIIKIPQTTSLVTVAAICGVGLYHQQINTAKLLWMLPFWVILPLLSFGITYWATQFIYPPRKINFWLYERLVNHHHRLKIFVIVCSCYNAFSVGTNNVANVVGPLLGTAHLSPLNWLCILSLVFATGAWLFPGPLETSGQRIVPLGLLTASIISLVSGSLIIFASIAGVPQSFVMLQMGAIFAVAAVKKGGGITFSDPITKKTFLTWTINPIITLAVSYVLAMIIF